MIQTISIFPYANVSPLRFFGPPQGFRFVYRTPKQSVDAFERGIAVSAPIPIGALPQLTTEYELLGSYGVAASKHVGSVLLFSQKPFDDLDEHATIALTQQSATSTLLLYVLLQHRRTHKLPQVTRNIPAAIACLVIGDEALIVKNTCNFPFCYDLVTLWHEQFSLPFVFARWIVRKDASTLTKSMLLQWLEHQSSNDSDLIATCASIEAERLGCTIEQMKHYLVSMRRKLTQDDCRAQHFFIDKVKPLYSSYLLWRDSSLSALPSTHTSFLYQNQRIVDKALCVSMLSTMPLSELMSMAYEVRKKKHPSSLITYVLDTNPNYTNICTTGCSFCAFYRTAQSQDAYTLSTEQLVERVQNSALKGATTVLLQGGLNPKIRFSQIIDYIRGIQKQCPSIHIHPVSPVEIDFFSRQENTSPYAILKTLWDEGISTIPGGGAEILVDSVRNSISPGKCDSATWIHIMETAHRIGFTTTATMMYGHRESHHDIIEHLFTLRQSQDTTGGYSSFIPWSFKPGNTRLSQHIPHSAISTLYIRIIAVARLILDNFDHIQSSWFSENQEAGCLGLIAGADDFGGILVEEQVLKSAGHSPVASELLVRQLIAENGFMPAQRDSQYQIKKIWKQTEEQQFCI